MNRILIFFIISIPIIFLVFFIIYKKRNQKINIYLISPENIKDVEINLISLPKDENRRKELKVKPNYTYSVDGKTLDRNELIKSNILDKDSKLKKGEIGCFLSHIYLLKKSIENKKKKYVLILEDDAKLNENIFKDIDNILKKAPKDFEMIFLGHNYYKEEKEEKENFELKKINYLHGAQAYIVNPNKITIEKINKLLPIKRPYDVIVPSIFKCYVVIPKIVTLSKHGSYSNTQGIN